MFRESIIAAVMSRHRHNGSRTVTYQHIIADIYGNLLPVERVHRITSGKASAHPFYLGHSLAFGAFFSIFYIFFDIRTMGVVGQFHYHRMFGRDNHERNAENGVRAGGEHVELVSGPFDVETYHGSFRTAYPVALYLFQRFAPLYVVEPVEHSLRIGSNPKQPLFHDFLFHGEPSPFRQAVYHLVVCKHRSEPFAPVYHGIGTESQTIVLQNVLTLRFVHVPPLFRSKRERIGAGRVDPFRSMSVEMGDKAVDRFRLTCFIIEIGLVHLYESPLGPMVILGIACTYLAVPVE